MSIKENAVERQIKGNLWKYEGRFTRDEFISSAGFARLISEPALARVVYNSPGVEPRKGRNPGYGINKKYEPRRGGIKGCIM